MKLHITKDFITGAAFDGTSGNPLISEVNNMAETFTLYGSAGDMGGSGGNGNNGGMGGCSVAGASSFGAPLLFGVAVLGLALRRRRRA